jgi:hypothetical protein
MINLSVIDRMNEQLNSITTTQVGSRIEELRSMIGKRFSDNHSSTLNSVLLSVSDCGNVAVTAEVPSEYNNVKPAAGTKRTPSWLVWNAMCS